MDIYVNTKKKVYFIDNSNVTIKDIADVSAPGSVKNKINSLWVLTKNNKSHEIIEFNEIVDIIHSCYPNATVINTGEKCALVEFSNKKKENIVLTYFKIIFVAIVIFAGSATAIMSFHTDAQLDGVFKKYTEIFLGKDGNEKIIEISYSIGLTVGIIVFFNHFGKRKFSCDPTPIQVEMSLYEDEVTKTLVNGLSNKKKE